MSEAKTTKKPTVLDDDRLLEDLKNNPVKERRLMKFIELAEKNREFEIKNYWVRTAFFGGIVAIAFTGLTNDKVTSSQLLQLLITSFGLICSLCWVLANLGAKYWQNNWEEKANNLTGQYFKTTETISHMNPFNAQRFSVSKIILVLSYFTFIFWSILFYNNSLKLVSWLNESWYYNICSIVPVLIIIGIFFIFAQSGTDTKYDNDKSDYIHNKVGCLLERHYTLKELKEPKEPKEPKIPPLIYLFLVLLVISVIANIISYTISNSNSEIERKTFIIDQSNQLSTTKIYYNNTENAKNTNNRIQSDLENFLANWFLYKQQCPQVFDDINKSNRIETKFSITIKPNKATQ